MGETLDDGVDLGQVTGALGQVGINALDSNGKMRDVGDVMEDLMDVWGQMDQTQKAAIATTLAGKYQLSRFEALMNRSDLYDEYKQSAQEGKDKGTLDVMNEKYLDSMEGKLNKLQATMEGVFNNIFESDDFYAAIDGVTNLVDLFSQLTDAVGGGDVALQAFGATALRIFSSQIGTQIGNGLQNLAVNKQKRDNSKTVQDNLNALGFQNIENGRLTDLRDSMMRSLDLSAGANDEQREALNRVNAQLVETKQAQITAEQELIDRTNALNLAYKTELEKQNYGAIEVNHKEYTDSNGNKQISAFREEADTEGLQAIERKNDVLTNKAIDNLQMKYREASTTIEFFAKQLNNAQEELIDGQGNATGAAFAVEKLEKAFEQVDKRILLTTEQSDALEDALKAVKQASLNAGESIEVDIENLTTSLEEAISKTRALGDSFNRLAADEKSTKAYVAGGSAGLQAAGDKSQIVRYQNENAKKEAGAVEDQIDFSQQISSITNAVGAVGQLAMTWESFQNLGSLWANADVEAGEKLTQTVMNLAINLPMLISAFSALNQLRKDTAFTEIATQLAKQSAGYLELANSTRAAAAAQKTASFSTIVAADKFTMLGTSANVASKGIGLLGRGLAALSGPIGIAITLGTMLIGIFKDYSDQQWANQVNDASEAAQKASDTLSTLTSTGQSFSGTFEQYKQGAASSSDLKNIADQLNETLDDQTLKALAAAGAWDQYNNALKGITEDKAKDSLDKLKYNQQILDKDTAKNGDFVVGNAITNKSDTPWRGAISNALGDDSSLVIGYNGGYSFKRGTNTQQRINDVETAKDIYQQQIAEAEKSLAAAEEGSELYNTINSNLAKLNSEYESLQKLESDNSERFDEYKENQKQIANASVSLYGQDSAYQIQDGQTIDDYKNTLKESTPMYQQWVQDYGQESADALLDSFVDGMASSDTENGKQIAKQAAKEKTEEAFGQGLYTAFDNGNAVNNYDVFANSQVTESTSFGQQVSGSLSDVMNNLPLGVDSSQVSEQIYDSIVSSVIQQVNDSSLSEEDKQRLMSNIDWSQPIDEILGTIGQSIETGQVQESFDESSDQNDRTSRLTDTYKVDSSTITAYEDIQKQSDTVVETQNELQAALDETSAAFGDESAEAKAARKKLDGYNNSVGDLAKMSLQSQKGMEALSESIEDNAKVIRNGDKNSIEYAEAISETREAVADLLNVTQDDISVNFVEENIDDIEKAAYGDIDAIQRLRNEAAQDILINISKDPNSNLSSEELDYLSQKAQELSFMTIEPNAMLDDTDFIASLNEMLANGKMTAEQVNSYLNAIGYDPNIEMEEVTQTMFSIPSKDIDIEVLGKKLGGIHIPDMEIQGTVKVPKITSVDALGSGKGYTPVSSKAASNRPSSSGGGGSKGGGGGGGGSSYEPKTKDKIDDEADRYERVNTQLEKIGNELDRIADEQDRLTGDKLAKNMEKQIQLLQRQKQLQQEKLQIQQQEAQELQNKLSSQYGVQFDSEGYMSNYYSIHQGMIDNINNLTDQYNNTSDEAGQDALEKQIEDANKALDKFNTDYQRYDDLWAGDLEDTKKALEDIEDKIEDIRISAFKKGVEAADNIKEIQESLIEFNSIYKDIYQEDPFNAAADSVEKLGKYFDVATGSMSEYYDTMIAKMQESANQEGVSDSYKTYAAAQIEKMKAAKAASGQGTVEEYGTGYLDMAYKNVNDMMEQINQFNKTGKSDIFGEDSAAMYEVAKDIFDQATSLVKDYSEEATKLRDHIIDCIDKMADAAERRQDSFQAITDQLEHQLNIVQMLHGENAYDEMNAILDAQQGTYIKQISEAKQVIDNYKELLAKLPEGSEEWKAVQDKIIDAQSKLNDLVETSLEKLQQKYENTVNKITNAWVKNALGTDVDWMSTQWELINRNADYYLDDVNRAYNIQKLQGKYLDLLDKSNDLNIQKKITDQMEQQLDTLHKKTKLSEYDVQYANAQLEILQKQIALEDAQRNKNQMKLRRDSQGNYSYVYTANQDNVRGAESDLLDAKNNAYNLSKEQMKQTQDDSLSALKDAQSTLNDIWTNANLTLEEKKNRTTTIIDSLKEYLTATGEQLGTSEQNIIQDFLGMCEMLTDENKTQLDDVYQQLLQKNNDAFDQIDTRWNTSLTNWLKHLGDFNTSTENMSKDLISNSQAYQEKTDEVANAVKENFNDVKDVINGCNDATKTLAGSTESFINQLNNDSGKVKEYENNLQSLTGKITDMTNTMGVYKQQLKDMANELTKEKQENLVLRAEIEQAKNGSGSGGSGGSGSGGSTEDIAYRIANSIWHTDDKGGWGDDPDRDRLITKRYGHAVYEAVQALFNSGYGYSGWIELGRGYEHYDTGGYTGEWGQPDNTNGRFAMLHQKELVLNETDTANILEAVRLVRDMTENGLSNMVSSAQSQYNSVVGKLAQALDSNKQSLDQNVQITAEFPNAENFAEIRAALESLNGYAAQYAYRTK